MSQTGHETHGKITGSLLESRPCRGRGAFVASSADPGGRTRVCREEGARAPGWPLPPTLRGRRRGCSGGTSAFGPRIAGSCSCPSSKVGRLPEAREEPPPSTSEAFPSPLPSFLTRGAYIWFSSSEKEAQGSSVSREHVQRTGVPRAGSGGPATSSPPLRYSSQRLCARMTVTG